MLQLKDIRKSYTTGSFTQTALDGVSLSFRDNEFVAILGPSGSGKTTLLNIIGGLDHYDSGDLVIEGVSTKNYKDRDWDTFRNNRIGFVFQSYNLIPHQSVLANVELALTLSGVGREERHARALEALEKVGLAEHVNKKPSQLSGGQAQRVAIARALINNPEILLADEPTGALDSKTSVQIMDLLTEIAHDRLVIMVTHNPELAQQYATRIVQLSDGQITSDSDPYTPSEDESANAGKKIHRTSMSFLTALSLSFNNLMTKKGRTIMTAFAGSIGIIGIAAILALANGVNAYIASVEEETLSEYPLQITSTGYDFSSLITGSVTGAGGSEGDSDSAGGEDSGDAGSADGEGDASSGDATTDAGSDNESNKGNVRVSSIITSMLSTATSNDLTSLKQYLESGDSGIDEYAKSVEYVYNVAPQIYTVDGDSVRQVNPDTTFETLGFGSTTSANSLMSSMSSTDLFYEMPSDESLYIDQYDVVAGHWPENYNECVLVLTKNGYITDFEEYILSLRDYSELEALIDQFANDEDVDELDASGSYNYEDIVGITYKLVNAADYYSYDGEYGVWVDKTDDVDFMRSLVEAGEDITIVGIVQPNKDASATMLSAGINYPSTLIDHIIEYASDTEIVAQQLANPSIDVFSGNSFTDEENAESDFDMSSLFSIDEAAVESAFSIDSSALTIDQSRLPTLDTSGIANAINLSDVNVINTTAMATLMSQVMNGYMVAFQADPTLTFEAYMESEGNAVLAAGMASVVDTSSLESTIATQVQTAVASTMSSYVTSLMSAIQSQLASNLANAMQVDTDAFANAISLNLDETELTELMMSLMTSDSATYESNLSDLGYADAQNPYEIDIYPIDFEAKEHITEILDTYNDDAEAAGEEDKVITYTDYVGLLMSSVTEIINMISAVLIAFVAISLIVSSIMIGVITYISVLERKKEIGILRAIGASKNNISQVFNAETVIEGLVAGLLGVGITALGCIPANIIVYNIFNVPNVALLPLDAALVLVLISVALTFIAGLIPARSASHKDPVEALRSE